jgi:hypothetical protein
MILSGFRRFALAVRNCEGFNIRAEEVALGDREVDEWLWKVDASAVVVECLECPDVIDFEAGLPGFGVAEFDDAVGVRLGAR